ncbi:MAG: type II toxin-antitoxin system prevent-host-death family antitoxin [Burkholderiaceae bacterium]|nr:type II toxin-antitoxin system prevent-host-death family antitoxin [Burkholderiaceae bacterium]
MSEGPQLVTKRGVEAAVLVDVSEWRRLKESARPSLKELLLTPGGRGNLRIPVRGSARRRSPERFS